MRASGDFTGRGFACSAIFRPYRFQNIGRRLRLTEKTRFRRLLSTFSRGRIDAYVTHRPADKAWNVVHFDGGYAFKDGSTAELDIDKNKFMLFTAKEAAWANDAAEDKAVTDALNKGKRAIIKGVSARGTNTTDSYALDGYKDALAAIDKACGVKR